MTSTDILYSDPLKAAEIAAAEIASRTGVASHDVALVMGSGWVGAVDALGTPSYECNAEEITGFFPPAVEGHSGKVRSYEIKDGRTILTLSFESWDAYFIVFSGTATAPVYNKPISREKTVLSITTPWKVNFQADRGAPATATFDKLISWPTHADSGIKYFSGTASYQNTFSIPALAKGAKYELDLGDVKNLAEVFVNGQNMGIVWKKPFKIDISAALKAGVNTVEIKVTNLWVNRLIGDAQPGAVKTTFTTMPFYQANGTLLPSGLLGPVVLKQRN
jgi:hypothetical protein